MFPKWMKTAILCCTALSACAKTDGPVPVARKSAGAQTSDFVERTVRLRPRTPEEQKRRPPPGRIPHRTLSEPLYNYGGTPPPATPSGYVYLSDRTYATYTVAGDATSSDSISYHGGPLIQTTTLQLIFWGSAWRTAVSPSEGNIIDAVTKLLNGPYLLGLGQYAFQSINLGSAITVLDDPPVNFGFDHVSNLVWDLIDQGQYPEPDDGGRFLYMVFMPASANDPAAKGEHGDPSDYDFPADADYAWVAWIGDGPIDYVTDVFTHELVESITDPEPDSPAWTMNRVINRGNEIGDACVRAADYVNGVFVTGYWSQAQQACVIPFQPPPTATYLFPSFGGPAGGTQVRIDGTNFDTSGSTKVTFGGVPASVNCPSTTQCFATSPPGNGIVDVQVTVNHWTTPTGLQFYYVPSIISVTPQNGTVGDSVTIHGIGFNSAASVNFGTFPGPGFSCNATDCSGPVPFGSGIVHVGVTVNGSQTTPTFADLFTYRGPTITSIDKHQGSIWGGTEIDVFGSGFGQGVRFFFGYTEDTQYVLCENSTWCSIRSPQVSASGPVDIRAYAVGAWSPVSAADVFTYTDYPAVEAIFWSSISNDGAVRLDSYAPPGGLNVSVDSSDRSAVLPSSPLFIAGGTLAAPLTLQFLPTPNSETVTLTASYAGTSASTTVFVYAWPPLSMNLPDSLATGASATVTVSMASAPSVNAVIALASTDSTAIPVPGSVTIPAGGHQATFVITNYYAGLPKPVTISATGNGLSTSGSVYVPTTPGCVPRRCPPGSWFNPDDCACERGLPR